MQKLVKRLKRELKASPKKAALLGVTVVVAGYFYVPLLMGKSDPAKENATKNPAHAASTVATPTEIVAASAPPIEWSAVDAAMTQDARRRVSDVVAPTKNPFSLGAKPVAIATAESAKAEKTAEDQAPEDLGLVLTTTLVGSSKKSATINGRTYRLGGKIEAAEGIEFVLASVEPRQIVLERAGHRYVLSMADAHDAKSEAQRTAH